MTQLDTADAADNDAQGSVKLSATQLHDLVMQSIDDDKGQDIVSIPLAGKSSLADYMVVASGTSTRQVAAMAQKLSERIKKQGGTCRIEGMANADWVLIDAGDVIIHLFRPEVRSFYNLERMWAFDEDGLLEDISHDEESA